MSSEAVLQTVDLGLHWPTIDPFLFCAHHRDDYPNGNGRLGPDAPLEERSLGMDFEIRDGWRMYHGSTIPGFPRHPHRGFETVTYVREGFCDHSDSLGASARFGQGDVQWLTAGAGIVHSEMFPLRFTDRRNPVELFQIWLNLPAANKMATPEFKMIWNESIPRHTTVDHGDGIAEIVVIAGKFDSSVPPRPPDASWANDDNNDVAIWHIHLDPGTSLELPPAQHPDTNRTLYVFDGDGLFINDHRLGRNTGSVVTCDSPLTLGSENGADCLVLQGRPIGESVAQQGPFVMNNETELRQTFTDFEKTGFGGWPWPSDGPVHNVERGRFALHPDGRVEEP